MDAIRSQIDFSEDTAQVSVHGAVSDLPAEVYAWLEKTPAEHIARWRMELAAGLRDAEGRLTCANLNDPSADLSEAERISEALMQPSLRQWLATPAHEHLREWRAQK